MRCERGGGTGRGAVGPRALGRWVRSRRWRQGSGDFTGSRLTQCPLTFEITVGQEEFVDKLRPVPVPRGHDTTVVDSDEERTERSLRSDKKVSAGPKSSLLNNQVNATNSTIVDKDESLI